MCDEFWGTFFHFSLCDVDFSIIMKSNLIFRSCKSHHDVLEVPKDATDKDILAAFKKLALLVHPGKLVILIIHGSMTLMLTLIT